MTRLAPALLIAALSACNATSAPAHADPAAPAAVPCADAATHFFSCKTKAGKQVLVCAGTEPDRWVHYQYGPAGKPELVYPAERAGSHAKFKVEERTTPMASGYVLSFTNEGVTYEVSEMAGAGGPNGDANNFAGITIIEKGATIATVACDGPATSRWLDLDVIVHPQGP